MSKSGFGEALRTTMKERKLRIVDVSEQTGIGQSQISQYLSGVKTPSAPTVRLIASALNWPVQDALHAAGRHDTHLAETTSEMIPGLSEIAALGETLGVREREALGDLLRDVARSYVSRVVQKLGYYQVLTCSFFAGFFQQFSRFRASLHSPTIAV